MFRPRPSAFARFAPALAAATLLLAPWGMAPAQDDAPPPETLAEARRRILEQARGGWAAPAQLPLGDGESRPPDFFRLASYNVQLLFDAVDDPDIDDQDFEAKPKEQLEALASVLKALDADIVGLQEIEHGRALRGFMETYLPDAGYGVYLDEPPNSMFNVALLSRYPVKQSVRYGDDAQDGPFRYLRHRIVAFEVEVAPDYVVWVVVCHWKASGDDRSRAMRADMARATREFIVDRLKLDPQKDNVAILGDFNDVPDSEPLKLLVGEGDDFTELGATTPEKELTHPSREPGRQIDYIVVSRGLGCEWLNFRAPGVPDLATLALASDHLPVVGVFFDRENGYDAESKKKSFLQSDPARRSRLIEVAQWPVASETIRANRDRDMAEALDATDGVATSIAKARADFLALAAAGDEEKAPVIAIEGVALCDPGLIGGRRVQFSFADVSGGILVDAPNARHFSTMPKKGDRLRLVGKVVPYREILEFRPLAEPENYGPAPFQPQPPALTVAQFVREGEKYLGGRVLLEDAQVLRAEAQQNSGVKYTVRSTSAGEDRVVVYVDANLKAKPPVAAAGQQVLISGMVSKFRGTLQILPLEPEDVFILDEGHGDIAARLGAKGAAPLVVQPLDVPLKAKAGVSSAKNNPGAERKKERILNP